MGLYHFESAKGGWQLIGAGKTGFSVNKEAPEYAKVIFALNITTKELIEKQVKFKTFIHYRRSYNDECILNQFLNIYLSMYCPGFVRLYV